VSPSITAGLDATLGGAETADGFRLSVAFATDVAVVGDAPLDPDALTAPGPLGLLPLASLDAGAGFCIADASVTRRGCCYENF